VIENKGFNMINKKVALVTGGTRGIGKAIAVKLAKKGYNIVFTYFSSEKRAEEVKKQIEKIGVKSFFMKVDNSKKDEIEKMVNKVLEKFGQIDVLVNNAGISQIKNIEEISEKDWNKVVDTNLKGTFFFSQLVFKHMKSRKKGRIINIASQAGTTGGFFIGAHYCASKSGMICLTKSFAKNGAPFNILVNSVSPGLIKTDMLKPFPDKNIKNLLKNIPVGRLGEPDDVAKVVAFLISDDASYITGADIPVNGGLLM
jgi:3-oxoacyl-[acyl-carrier protein] reductase